jgi:uncharacterized protein (DUF2267 family)
LQESLKKANDWIDELNQEMGWDRPEDGLMGLRAALHTLRDRLTPEEAAHLGAQLPVLIRGIYYEGWHPAHKPMKIRTRDEFLALIQERYRRPDNPLDPGTAEALFQALFRILQRRVTEGELEDVRRLLPESIQSMIEAP